jgi:hypothetical protein
MRRHCFLQIILIAAAVCQVKAQLPEEKKVDELGEYFKEQYGPDQLLINGISYYNLHIYVTGHKFLGEDEFRSGKLLIENREYNELLLKYDLYNQQIILQSTYGNQIYNEIIISNSRIREFELDGKVFRKCYPEEKDNLFCQIIETEDLACCYHWTKSFIPLVTDKYNQGEFHIEQKDSYVLWNSNYYKFKGAKSFSKIFPEHQSTILKHIRKNKIKIKKATDSEMEELLKQCNKILRS